MQAHSAPLSIEVVPRNNGLFPSLRNQFVIGFHGSWNRTTPTGYKVVSVDPNAAKSGEVDLVTGWLVGNQAWGRPVDVKFSPKGQLFISDDSAGAIYIVKK
jgi:glucose/arabinose dehydrogenase